MYTVIVRGNIIENITVPGPKDGPAPEGTTAHKFDGFASVGWLWNAGNPVDPNPPPPRPEPSNRAKRQAAYPQMADFDTIGAWIEACDAVNAKYPEEK